MSTTPSPCFMDELRSLHANSRYDRPVANGLANPFEMPDEQGYFWLKGNLHCHTTRSDGKLSPQQRLDGYAARGFDFLSLTDHQYITPIDDLRRPEDFILIPGAELHPRNPFGGQLHHFLSINLKEDIPALEMSPQEVIDAVRAQGGLPWLAHPHWSSVIINRDVLALKGLAGIEVMNSESTYTGRAEAAVHWDDWMWLTDSLIPAIGVDDAHGGFGPNEPTCGAWTMVRVKERTAEAVLRALETGASYSSAGPNLYDVSVRQNGSWKDKPLHEIRVVCSPAVRVNGVCDVYGGTCYEGGRQFTEARIELPPLCRWVRIEVVDSAGLKAWSNPIPLH